MGFIRRHTSINGFYTSIFPPQSGHSSGTKSSSRSNLVLRFSLTAFASIRKLSFANCSSPPLERYLTTTSFNYYQTDNRKSWPQNRDGMAIPQATNIRRAPTLTPRVAVRRKTPERKHFTGNRCGTVANARIRHLGA